jgi:hypothetical protein
MLAARVLSPRHAADPNTSSMHGAYLGHGDLIRTLFHYANKHSDVILLTPATNTNLMSVSCHAFLHTWLHAYQHEPTHASQTHDTQPTESRQKQQITDFLRV